MQIGVLGTGMVGETIASKLVDKGHEVMMGSRQVDHEKAVAWVSEKGSRAKQGTFADAAAFGEIVFNCTLGSAALSALQMADAENLLNKILIDVSNPLDFSKGIPPSLFVSNTDSLGEQIQRAFPKTKVIKTLNTLNCALMCNPSLLPGDHNIFISGNDQTAKDQVVTFLVENFGWKRINVIDLGDITTARATEALLPLWLRLWHKFQTPNFNFQIVRSTEATK